MTIGIGAHGPGAGGAILRALETAEKICSGAIGGFVAAAAVSRKRVERAQTQTGGASHLQFDTSRDQFESACTAALISSGPNRPGPLSAFVSARAGIGVVSGHRMPNAIGTNDKPMNQTTLDLMATGCDPQSAVDQVINVNPLADCGLIAVAIGGRGHAANTAAVRRPDARRASARRGGARVWVLHNAVHPVQSLAPLIAEIALDAMRPLLRNTGYVTFKPGCTVEAGESAQIHVDENHDVEKIITCGIVADDRACALNIGYQPAVLCNGGEIAKLLYEPLLIAENKCLRSADGETLLTVPTGVLY